MTIKCLATEGIRVLRAGFWKYWICSMALAMMMIAAAAGETGKVALHRETTSIRVEFDGGSFFVDNYYALMAVLDRANLIEKMP
jgi:hypothetical protein